MRSMTRIFLEGNNADNPTGLHDGAATDCAHDRTRVQAFCGGLYAPDACWQNFGLRVRREFG
jgi:hypothetical protein